MRIWRVLYTVRHENDGHEAVSPSVPAELAVETACAMAAAGRRVTVHDAEGRPVDLDALAEEVMRARGASGSPIGDAAETEHRRR